MSLDQIMVEVPGTHALSIALSNPLPKQDIQNVYDFCTKCIHQKYTFCITKDQLGCIHFVYVRYTFCMQHLELKQTNKCIQNVYITHIVVYKMYTSLTLYTKCIH